MHDVCLGLYFPLSLLFVKGLSMNFDLHNSLRRNGCIKLQSVFDLHWSELEQPWITDFG